MGPLAPDVAGVGLDRAGIQAAAPEDAVVGVKHGLIGDVGGFERGVEAVGVLHDEFLGTHQAESRADFIAELGLYLVDGTGELAVRGDLTCEEIGDNLLVGGAEGH